MTLTTFDSTMETARRQDHGLIIRKGPKILRRASASIGYDAHRWEWKEEGAPSDFENTTHYKAKHVNARLNRSVIAGYINRFGVDIEKSLFARIFKDSLHLWPLPYDAPSASRFYCHAYEKETANARSRGVQSRLPEPPAETPGDVDFLEMAEGIVNLRRWEQLIETVHWKAGQSSERAKTDAGRLRAQWRVVDVVKQIQEEAVAAGLAPAVVHGVSKTNGLDAVMKELGKDTDAYEAFVDCYKG